MTATKRPQHGEPLALVPLRPTHFLSVSLALPRTRKVSQTHTIRRRSTHPCPLRSGQGARRVLLLKTPGGRVLRQRYPASFPVPVSCAPCLRQSSCAPCVPVSTAPAQVPLQSLPSLGFSPLDELRVGLNDDLVSFLRSTPAPHRRVT